MDFIKTYFHLLPVLLLASSTCSFYVYGHGGKKHTGASKSIKIEKKPNVVISIKRQYEKKISPIFQKSCFSCHSKNQKLPWYSSIPIVSDVIDYDITESKKHLDMTDGYPFIGHGDPIDDLKSIKKSIENGSMPPLRYKIFHLEDRLTEVEKKEVLKWINESVKLLNQN